VPGQGFVPVTDPRALGVTSGFPFGASNFGFQGNGANVPFIWGTYPLTSQPAVVYQGVPQPNNGPAVARGFGGRGTFPRRRKIVVMDRQPTAAEAGVPIPGVNTAGVRGDQDRDIASARSETRQDLETARDTTYDRMTDTERTTTTRTVHQPSMSRQQVQLARQTEDIMLDRPMSSGEMVKWVKGGCQVKVKVGDEYRTEFYPVDEVFFFRANGDMASAQTHSTMLRPGQDVLVPSPEEQQEPRQSVAGSREEYQGKIRSNVGGSRQNYRSRRPAK
jgi:hypothetical protein